MLRRLGTNKKSLVIVPVALVLALTWLFLPVKEVSIEPYGTLSLESRVVITTGYQAAYASPAEYLQNPSFTGGDTNWTLDVAIYDAIDYHDSAGSIKTITDPKKNNVKIGTCSQTISTQIGSSDTVKLSLYWKKGVTSTAVAQDLRVQIALPNTPAVFIDIWSDTQTGDIDWTAVTDEDVSAYFTETGTYQFRYYMNLKNPNLAEEVWAWIDNTSLDVAPAISNTSATGNAYNFGTVAESSSTKTGLGYFEVTNNSPAAVSITIGGSDMNGGVTWTLSEDASIGENIYGLRAGLYGQVEGNDYTVIVPKSSANTLIGSLGASSSQQWGLQFLAPDTFTDGIEKSGTVTLTAAF